MINGKETKMLYVPANMTPEWINVCVCIWLCHYLVELSVGCVMQNILAHSMKATNENES